MTAEVSPSRFRLGPSLRVLILCVLLGLVAAWLLVLSGNEAATVGGGGIVPWMTVAVAYALSEVWVVHLQFRGDAHTVSLSEIPLTVGLFFLAPRELVPALLVGVAPVLVLYRRQSVLKLSFNLLQLAVAAAVAALIFHAAAGASDPLGPRSWLVALLATLCAATVSALTVSAAISLTDGRLSLAKVASILPFALAGAVVNTGLGLVGVVVAYRDPRAAALLVLPSAALYGAYQLYNRERQKTERIEFLYNSGRTLTSKNVGNDTALGELLRSALDMFRAEVAEVTVWDPSGTTGKTRTTVTADKTLVVDEDAGTPSGERILEDVMARGQGMVMGRADSQGQGAEFLASRGLRDAVITSLTVEGRVIGTILVGNWLGDVSGFNREHLNLLETLASQVGVAVENARLEEVLKHQAFHDALTNLANRALINRRLEAVLEDPGNRIAVLLVDIDDFKVINDTMGHTVGDQLLVSIAERLRDAIRAADTAARIGGDEFAVLVEGLGSEADAVATARRVLDAFGTPFSLAGQEVRVTASVGIATNLEGLLDPGTLLLQADVAMYAAKAEQRGSYRVFEASMQDEVAERHALREDLRRALERGELVNHYQPLLSLEGPRVVGMEALVRWHHPERGMVAPGFFIRLAEESGLILQLGRWVLREACQQLREWQRQFPVADPLTVSVNLSAVQLRQPGFVDDVLGILKETGLDPRSLTLEITESTFMDDTRTAIARLRELRGLGIRLELDDFGTGFSSLSILRDLPLDGLKIDKSFVDGIGAAADRPAFLQAIVRLADALDLDMVGEGIEHEHQATALQLMGCTRGQGYLFSRPLGPADMEIYLRRSFSQTEPSVASVVAIPRRRRSD